MAGKIKISADLMDRVMDGTLSGPDAMKVEMNSREIARALKQREAGYVQVKASNATIQRLTGENERLLGVKNEDAQGDKTEGLAKETPAPTVAGVPESAVSTE